LTGQGTSETGARIFAFRSSSNKWVDAVGIKADECWMKLNGTKSLMVCDRKLMWRKTSRLAMRGRKESLHLHNPLSLSLSLIRLKTILDPADHGLILKLLLMNNLLETFRLGSHPNTKTTQRQKKGNKELARKQDENGKVLEERHLIDLICDTGENGDEINEPLIIEASRNEFKALCGVLRGIGDGEAWLKLCLRVQPEFCVCVRRLGRI
jgi:hypothetical protein